MKKTPCLPRLALVWWFALSAACVTTSAGAPEGRGQRVEPKEVRASPLPGGALKLTFEPVAPAPALERLRVEEARAVLADVHESLRPKERSRLRLVLASTASGDELATGWRSRLREEFLSRFGPSRLPLPQSLEASPVFQALKLSPRYMGEGIREAAHELFTSPVFLTSVGLSVFFYFAAWLAPEPVFTKAFVAMVTLRLALAVGVLELTRVAQACVRLYQEAEAARTPQELEAVAERFGKAIGGTGLRVLMLVAGLGVSKRLPQVPEGGLATLLRIRRHALPGGLSLESTEAVQMVADGTLIVTGVVVGTAAATAGSACTDGSETREGHHWHHLATNKNDISAVYGGPWTPLFKSLFTKAGMTLDTAENLVYLAGHQGPHPEAYHVEVYERLKTALGRCRTREQCGDSLKRALKELADEVCSPGSRLHRLATKN